MPKAVWTYSELARVIPLRFKDKSYIAIARELTSENLKKLDLPDGVFSALDAINKKRVRDTRQKALIREMEDAWACVTAVDGGEVPLDSDMLLKSAVLMPHRLQWFESHNPLYKELMADYEAFHERLTVISQSLHDEWVASIVAREVV